MARHKRQLARPMVEPELPITPFLDMSFQLLAFFVLTFRPMPTEGQLPLILPPEDGSPSQAAPLNPDPTQPNELIYQVFANDQGQIVSIVASDPTGERTIAEGDNLKAYNEELQAKAEQYKTDDGKLPKLQLQLGEELNYEYMIRLIDIAKRAGFDKVSPAPLPGS